ncbi:hypothetical protein ACZ91_48665 [Streptomyces regensis]|nr:hypothetical protein ACZ91_48665 [Streptomyces regensis]
MRRIRDLPTAGIGLRVLVELARTLQKFDPVLTNDDHTTDEVNIIDPQSADLPSSQPTPRR